MGGEQRGHQWRMGSRTGLSSSRDGAHGCGLGGCGRSQEAGEGEDEEEDREGRRGTERGGEDQVVVPTACIITSQSAEATFLFTKYTGESPMGCRMSKVPIASFTSAVRHWTLTTRDAEVSHLIWTGIRFLTFFFLHFCVTEGHYYIAYRVSASSDSVCLLSNTL